MEREREREQILFVLVSSGIEFRLLLFATLLTIKPVYYDDDNIEGVETIHSFIDEHNIKG